MDVSDILYFFLLGGGEGESEAPGSGWVRFLLKIPRAGRFSGDGGGGGARGLEGVCKEFGGEGGGYIFFRVRNSHQGTPFETGIAK